MRSAAEHKVVDIFVLLILHANNHKKPVESLIRNKVRRGHFTEVLLKTTFAAHAQVKYPSKPDGFLKLPIPLRKLI